MENVETILAYSKSNDILSFDDLNIVFKKCMFLVICNKNAAELVIKAFLCWTSFINCIQVKI